ncbi:MAG: hypothetical protein HY043_20870 [Verrucomicrobia bacterium]|nr:hypothetical protein [Verrucomicrobiota bacterium]
MSRPNLTLTTVAILLAVAYVFVFSDWFNVPRIQIIPQTRPIRSGDVNVGVYPVSFMLERQVRINSVKVVEAGAYEANKKAPALWHLVSKVGSTPMQGFLYGDLIAGMTTARSNELPHALEPKKVYRILIEAGRARGTQDFSAQAINDAGN